MATKNFFEDSRDINPIKNTAVDKSMSDDKLIGLLRENKQVITDNIEYANELADKAEHIRDRARKCYYSGKAQLTAQEIQDMEEGFKLNSKSNAHVIHDSEEEKCLHDIDNRKRKLLDAMFQAKFVDEALTSKGDARLHNRKDAIVNDSRTTMQQLNSLEKNIHNGVDSNESIRQELKDRGVSLYPEEFTNTMTDEYTDLD